MERLFFLLGKGGVGKTTSAASLALYLSGRGKSVFWASIDPAHNLWDVLGMEGRKGVVKVEENLWAQEVDLEEHLHRFLKETSRRMKELYRHLQIVNLEGMLDVIRYSPGMEESAVLYALREILDNNREKDYIVIDTPPTGLTLRIFSLPFSVLMWIGQLRKWRKKILDRRGIVASILGREALGREVAISEEEDGIYRELERQEAQARFMAELFRNGGVVRNVLVLNQDRLSLMESKRIKAFLDKMGMPLSMVLLNKVGRVDEAETRILEAFPSVPLKRLPHLGSSPGVEDLRSLGGLWAQEVL